MKIRTRYRVLYNGVNYKIQEMIVIFRFFKKGNFKRVWSDLGSTSYDDHWEIDYYTERIDAIKKVVHLKAEDKKNSIARKNKWKQVYPP